MNVLVTGATGFVAANVVVALSRAGYAVVALQRGALDDDLRWCLQHGSGEIDRDDEVPDVWRASDDRRAPVTFVQGDVRDAALVERVMVETRPTHVLHMAAVTPAPEEEREKARAIVETNELATLALLLVSARHGVERVVLTSSAAVYAPGDIRRPLDEDAPLHASGGLYALTKLAAERLCGWAAGTFGLDTRIARIGPVYGPWERPSGSRRRMSPVCDAVRLALGGEPLRVYGAWASRDFIHAADVAGALVALLAATHLRHVAYNLAGEDVTISQMLNAVVANVPGARWEAVEREGAANLVVAEATRGPLDTRRLRQELYLDPRSIERGVREYVEWEAGERRLARFRERQSGHD